MRDGGEKGDFMRWQHLRSSRKYNERYCLGIDAAGKYARFTAGREGTQFCVYVFLTEQPQTGIKTVSVDQNGSVYIPVKYDSPECVSIDKALDTDTNTYRIMEASEWQISNELMHRNINQPTGWFQKSPVITVRREDAAFLIHGENQRFYSLEVFGSTPAIFLIAADECPGSEWRDRTHALKKGCAFGVSSKYAKQVGLMRNTQLQAIRTEMQVHGSKVPCYCFLAPDHNDAVTGRVINESLEPVIRLDVKKEADEQLSTVREYFSHTDGTVSFSNRISATIDMLQKDRVTVDALMADPAFRALLKKSTARRRTV